MRVLVLGGGVIGVSTAYYLARAGHEVSVLDRKSGVGLETSFANAGEISPGYSTPWAGPGVPLKALKWLAMEHSPLILHLPRDANLWRWLVKFLRNCTAERYQLNKSRMMRLAEYSRNCLRALRTSTGIEYDGRSLGTLQLFRTQQQLDAVGKDTDVLRAHGVPYSVLNVAEVIEHEPALARVQEKFVGGLHLPDDETGDCYKFTSRLAEMAANNLGVEFLYNTHIQRIVTNGKQIEGVVTDRGKLQADAYVVALGSYSPQLLRPIGISLPVYPVKGYSLTIPITSPDAAPESTVMDEFHKVAITRLGERVRVGGMAEINGFDPSLPLKRRATLDFIVNDLFPAAGNLKDAIFWTGLRPMTPDGTPVLGRTRYMGLFLNTGHGTLGWTMAAGSGRVVADMVSGRTPDIDTEGLSYDRYRRPRPYSSY